jgi:hypothetical protein
MAWAIGIGIFLLLLAAFPRFAIGLVVVFGLAVFAVFSAVNTANKRMAERRAMVTVSTGYDAQRCTPAHPVLVTITNRASATVSATSFTLKGYASGYSDPIYDSGYGQFRDDRIIEPQGNWATCWTVPRRAYNVSEELAAAFPPSSVIWRAENVRPALR